MSETNQPRGEQKFHYHPAALGRDVRWPQPVPCKRSAAKATPPEEEASADYTVSSGWDETGDETRSVIGKITAPTERIARARLATILSQAREDGNPAWNEYSDLLRKEETIRRGEGAMIELKFTYHYHRNSTDFAYDPAKEALKVWGRWMAAAVILVVFAFYLRWFFHTYTPRWFGS